MRLLGLDVGDARIGVALGDIGTGVATPLCVLNIRSEDDGVGQVTALAKQEGIMTVIIGIPRQPKDLSELSAQALKIKKFGERLRVAGLVVEEEDETLSTALASALGREAGRKGSEDDLAATAILQTYLDKLPRVS